VEEFGLGLEARRKRRLARRACQSRQLLAGGQLQPLVETGEPGHGIVGFGGGGAHLACAEDGGAVGEAEALVDGLGVSDQLFQFVIALLGRQYLNSSTLSN